MNIQVTHDGKTYNFENGSETFIFGIGTCHEMRDNQLISQHLRCWLEILRSCKPLLASFQLLVLYSYVSLVHECYLKDESDIPLGKFSDYVAMNWDRLKDLSPRTILCDFYNNNF